MILTEKSKTDFLIWYNKNYIETQRFIKGSDVENMFESLHESFKLSLIIDWLDYEGIIIYFTDDTDNRASSCEEYCENCENCYDTWHPLWEFNINVFSKIEKGVNNYNSFFSEKLFYSRNEATTKAIEKANNIYNDKI